MAKGSSKGKQGSYAGYKASSTCAKNGTKKLNRHLKKFPNDEQARLALGTTGYSRKAAGDKGWTFQGKPCKDRSFAQLVNSIVPNSAKTVIKGMFSLQTRAQTHAN